MKKFRLFIFGYRDQYFWSNYGPIVRDLMICKTLADFNSVDQITFYNRPVSIYERLLKIKTIKTRNSLKGISNKINFLDCTSLDILGPLSKRLWCQDIYRKMYATGPEMDSAYKNIIIDFLPIGDLPEWTQKADLIWYDLIDNFEKHNRYTLKEKKAVSAKYAKIKELPSNKSFVTGVSNEAICQFKNSIVLENGILNDDEIIDSSQSGPIYDFGFMGFITDKFDIEKINTLSELGFSIAIYGEFYDANVKSKVEKIKNVVVYGRFNHKDTKRILKTFRIGLIPYIMELLHDESPLKMFQYFSEYKLVLSCFNFNQKNSLLWVYSEDNFREKAKAAVTMVHSEEFKPLCDSSTKNYYWHHRLETLYKAIKYKCQ